MRRKFIGVALAGALAVGGLMVMAPADAASHAGPGCTFDVTRTGNLFTLSAGTCDSVTIAITVAASPYTGNGSTRSVTTSSSTTVEANGPVWAVSAKAAGIKNGVLGPIVTI